MHFDNRDDIIQLTPEWKGERFPNGLADVEALPEELSGSVQMAAAPKRRLMGLPATGGENA